jgi:hypothetical protein
MPHHSGITGFTKIMYVIVKNVVSPARTSIETVVLFFSLKKFRLKLVLQSSDFIYF